MLCALYFEPIRPGRAVYSSAGTIFAISLHDGNARANVIANVTLDEVRGNGNGLLSV